MGKYIVYTYNYDFIKHNLFYCDTEYEANEIKKSIDLILKNLNKINSNGKNILKFYNNIFYKIDSELYNNHSCKFHKKIKKSKTIQYLIHMNDTAKKEYI